jgi:hypothetical protein
MCSGGQAHLHLVIDVAVARQPPLNTGWTCLLFAVAPLAFASIGGCTDSRRSAEKKLASCGARVERASNAAGAADELRLCMARSGYRLTEHGYVHPGD